MPNYKVMISEITNTFFVDQPAPNKGLAREMALNTLKKNSPDKIMVAVAYKGSEETAPKTGDYTIKQFFKVGEAIQNPLSYGCK